MANMSEQERNEEIARRIAEFQQKESSTSVPSVRSETERLIRQAQALHRETQTEEPVRIEHEKIETFLQKEKRGRGRPRKGEKPLPSAEQANILAESHQDAPAEELPVEDVVTSAPVTETPSETPEFVDEVITPENKGEKFGNAILRATTKGQALRFSAQSDGFTSVAQDLDTSKLNMKSPQTLTVLHEPSDSSNTTLLRITHPDFESPVATFYESNGKTYITLSKEFVEKFNSQNPATQIVENEQQGFTYDVETLKLSKNLTIEDLRVSTQTKTFEMLFSALGCRMTTLNNNPELSREAYFRNKENPFSIEVSERFLDRVYAKDEVCSFDDKDPAKSALLIAEAHLQRGVHNSENPEKKQDILTTTIGSGKKQITLTSYPVRWFDKNGEEHSDYLYTMKEGKHTYVYIHATTEKSRSSLTAARFMRINQASLEATSVDDDKLKHPVLYLGVSGSGGSVDAIELQLNLDDETTRKSLIELNGSLNEEFKIEKRSRKKDIPKLTEDFNISTSDGSTATFDVYTYTARAATTLTSISEAAILSTSEKPLEKEENIIDPGPGGDNIDPGPGGDTIDPGPGGDNIDPGPGGDNIDPGPGGDTIDPGPGGDNIDPGPGGDTIDPGPGGDTIDPGPGGDNIDPGPGAPEKPKFKFNTKNLSQTNKNYLIGAFALVTVLSCLVPGLSIVSAVLLTAIGIDTFVDLGVISTLLNKGLDAIDKLKQPKKVKEKTFIKTLNKTLSKQKALNKENKKIRDQIEKIEKSDLSPEEKQKRIDKLQKKLNKNEEQLLNLFNDQEAQKKREQIEKNKQLVADIESRKDMSNYEKKREIRRLQKQIDKDNDYLYSRFSVETISAYAKHDPDGAVMFCQTYLAHGKELHEESISNLESIKAHLTQQEEKLQKALAEEKANQTALKLLIEEEAPKDMSDADKDFLKSIENKKESELTPEEVEMLKRLKGKFGIGLLSRLRSSFGSCSQTIEQQETYIRDVESYIASESKKTNPDGTLALPYEKQAELEEKIKQARANIAATKQTQKQISDELESLRDIPLDPSQMTSKDIETIEKLADESHGYGDFLRQEISESTQTSKKLEEEIAKTDSALRENAKRIEAEDKFSQTILAAQESIRGDAHILEGIQLSGESDTINTSTTEETTSRRIHRRNSRTTEQEGRDIR